MARPEPDLAERRSGALSAQAFCFVDRRFDFDRGQLDLIYRLDQLELTERLLLPGAPYLQRPERADAIEAALDLVHWIAGVSYWKAACPDELIFRDRPPDAWQAEGSADCARQGLAEFAFENQLDPGNFPAFPGDPRAAPAAPNFDLAHRSLVPMGGGKDSLVAWERLRDRGESPDSVQIGSAPLIRKIGGQLPGEHWVIQRAIAPGLAEINRAGALNGHVPVTAINSAILTLLALVLDYDRVAFANERSASQASRIDDRGREINHQYSKSFAFEVLLADWIGRYVHPSLRVFSLLRRDRELAICREFSELDRWHGLFSSCNRNFHLDGPRVERWCGQCPKCVFVYLCLAPFMQPAELARIFGQDLLARPDLVGEFAELLALDGFKPFECVGEAEEARAAVLALAGQSDWKDHVVVRELNERLAGIEVPSLETLCRPGGPHRIPEELLGAP